ncbi:50S ribosomal protein L3 [Candidatus Kaiserbacteria bacterium CG10_big_fil_rev_8_21_14_0_10_56_12]|uniref:50S ribosomal protein L3 n=1 Tax=Candidatus Kaiserbacteria bacterium CG10_big_fil_rev_8_21_14_0_10_56_12 TaxID=1974611 RepID=A0A2H0U9G8_9BACT|nr:MAG: 50S ribosomal protein L3 [Candidatus Kaiserbacteria bacterium CG10_big_fil_rev_8_21_14_0_10_56_12]
MKFILATKVGMTRIYGEDGRAHAGTVLAADSVIVTQVKTAKGKDGYAALQVGSGTRKTKNISKAVLGHTKGKAYKTIREFKAIEPVEVGSTIDVGTFAVGDMVRVSGLTKGKGFAGVVKRHGFHGGPRTHGQKHSEREAGSIGGGGGRAGGRVAKGIRMAGRMGGERVTVMNLKVLVVDPATGEMVVSGAVPGRRGTLLEVVTMQKNG